jgi:hypothetical protein
MDMDMQHGHGHAAKKKTIYENCCFYFKDIAKIKAV